MHITNLQVGLKRSIGLQLVALTLLLALFMAAHPLRGQEGMTGGGGGLEAGGLRLDLVVPAVASPPRSGPLKLRLVGVVPMVDYRNLNQVKVFASGPEHSCQLAWSPEVLQGLVEESGQPWLTVQDLVDEDHNTATKACGIIRELETAHIAISLSSPELMALGDLELRVAFGATETGKETRSTRPIAEASIVVSLGRSLVILGHKPASLVVFPNRDGRVQVLFEGPPPTRATMLVNEQLEDLEISVRGLRAEVTLPWLLLQRWAQSEPGQDIAIQLGNESQSAGLELGFCMADQSSAAFCNR